MKTDKNESTPKNSLSKKELRKIINIAIPVFEMYNGAVAYVDDLTITKPDGTAIANIGDQKENTKIEVSVGKTSRIILIVVVCLIVIAAVIGVIFIVSKFKNKFTN